MRQLRDRVEKDKTRQRQRSERQDYIETEQGKTIKYRDKVGKDKTNQRQSRER